MQTRLMPNLFIVGAAKSGTSSLWEYLNQHPEVYMSFEKEPGYFCDEWPGRKVFEKYLSLFKGANESTKRIGEASTCYLTCPNTAKNIYEYSQKFDLDTKIVILLRNPVHRAYSLYNWQVQHGYEFKKNLREALDAEGKRLYVKCPNFWMQGTYRYNYMYFHSGLYAEQVKAYLDIFGFNNVMIESFETFVKDVDSYLFKLFKFLNLENLHYKIDEPEVVNPSLAVHSPLLQYGLRKITRNTIETKVGRRIYRYKNSEKRDFLLRLGQRNTKPPKLESSTYDLLLEKYYPDIVKLEEYTGIDFSDWYNT